ncbi:hypothetical protein BX616_009997 [Lobosporangium transversale]|uniref:Integral membrane protein S linking to the trans Golgi network-domain-containing protein n=1 Tax=Lobosporangium transversale TaxID=64571 RepID=A0A1Y2GMM6_9FUNG|nr:integral membrane protein S linking to the trans Golgi network-domain-containing protein [Lobosporangium transversale]KAF9918193.1 hypothetical protein BX616_009997 [Lobosporangium transversale]ORZ16019.1 integral membrane protein S linking to the trans Golgi network-domain-containing protein [Lobosporangium transversale]|eukprot:XP_021881366.1 integral membrane protein S linking to the trans Golgi network-domain-containing protein [Lobosporangium transversale]
MAHSNSSFRATQWDPVLILSQIVCLQAVWYISISTIVFTLFKFSGMDITLDAILNYREIRTDNAQGMLLGLAWLLNSIIGVYLLLKIVARARLVLDFSLTLLLYHVIMTSLYSDHIPTGFLWWALNGTTAGIMIFGGEYVCMQQEMEPILLGGGSSSNNGGNSDHELQSRSASGAGLASTSGSGSGNNRNNNDNNTGSSSINNNESISNQSTIKGSHHLSLQGKALTGIHDGYSYGESDSLLMETFDSHSPDQQQQQQSSSLSTSWSIQPQKARSSGNASVVRSGFARSSVILGSHKQGRQRTSDNYKIVPISDIGTD